MFSFILLFLFDSRTSSFLHAHPPSASEFYLHLSCQLKLQEVEFISNLFLFYLYQMDLIRSPIQESLAHLLDTLT